MLKNVTQKTSINETSILQQLISQINVCLLYPRDPSSKKEQQVKKKKQHSFHKAKGKTLNGFHLAEYHKYIYLT